MNIRARRATLVVIELGGSWPRWLPPADTGDVAVVAQHYAGEPGSLVTQVASRVTRLEGAGWQLGTIVLISNGEVGAPAVAARAVLARGLVAHLGSRGGGRLVLAAEGGGRGAGSLAALAAALTTDARAARVELGLRLGSEPPLVAAHA
ncbi:MAG: hypothetical protein IT376_03550 [Polyangiaceae bacterium]|nr:hypothetical protein [Polyangiaceae bacterium]